jgi:hypothetical protein
MIMKRLMFLTALTSALSAISGTEAIASSSGNQAKAASFKVGANICAEARKDWQACEKIAATALTAANNSGWKNEALNYASRVASDNAFYAKVIYLDRCKQYGIKPY